MSLLHNLQIASSIAASSAALWRGTSAFYRKGVTQPEKTLTLYEFENCPYCRLVRLALTELHINVNIRPCPKGGKVWREEAKKIGGKAQFPLLVDENTDTVMYESTEIVQYLFNTYLGKVPNKWQPNNIKKMIAGGQVASAIRYGKGQAAKPSTQPKEPLTLYTFDSSPFGRLARERMCELELPYKSVNIGKEQAADMGPANRSWNRKPYFPAKGSKRETMQDELGHISSPYLVDPNTGTQMPESEAILAYLDKTYGK
ncbi:MAG: glutathione S-transferase N-terminal domain-containing protein [Gammaproteobacteria bacterium]|nr:glutathione S-transferase N-terminal domain-containing protein [Gammaproteobacteria bacterium]